ncbi:vacuolar protein sorting protein [Ascosphaera apis ARSEF 7405]|uniref:Vacuolar protein sorting/targeting protein 10 n=1 Tax=Ascosphaera apis ARSEF 7405 TaxID=392613 RepID=A0A162I492_9EURO|nr:vacuolar protein sorting protein [Ascosphaera apis ARSEF 7405]
MIIWRYLLAVGSLLLMAGLTSADKDNGPKITSTEFATEPRSLFYFEDSDIILLREPVERTIYRSTDAGKSWKPTAYVLSRGTKTHWVTEDAAETWREFEIKSEVDVPMLVFHGRDSKKVILQDGCAGFLCEPKAYYTDDGFKSNKLFMENAWQCLWAVSTPKFGEGLDLDKTIDDRILCIVPGVASFKDTENRLVYSDDYFKGGKQKEAPLNNGRAVSGVVSAVSVTKYLLAAVKSVRTNELALYVSDDANHWHRAEFDNHKLEEMSYTVLDSTDYSIQISVSTSPNRFNPMGSIFTSNSNGTYFTRNVEHVNGNELGLVDFEKVSGIDGIMMVNTVKNWEEIEKSLGKTKKLVSQISYDGGRTFKDLHVPKSEDKLHLHSVTSLNNVGRVFSSPAPGLVMGIGNTGDHLKDYSDGDLYVSDDGGRHWWKALSETQKYEFGDQGAVLVAVKDEGRTNKISYSLNHGKDWKSAELPQKIKAVTLTTTPDSTSLKFLLIGKAKENDGDKVYVMAIDFSDMHERHCSDKDFERWPARLNRDGEPICVMGQKQFYRRRKADADCFVNEEFKDPQPEFEPCACSEADFECDFNFVRSEDGKECVPTSALQIPEGQCKNKDDKYKGPSGYRLIPGNACQRKDGKELDKEVERSCKDADQAPVNTDIVATKKFFTTDRLPNYFYIERGASSSGHDETILMHTDQEEVWITHDHGRNWEQILKGKDIVRVVPHRYFNDVVYFLTNTETGYWTIDRGVTVNKFTAPAPFTRDKRLSPMQFHPTNRDWILWTGAADGCPTGTHCSNAHYSTNRGADWKLLNRYVKRCDFIAREGKDVSDSLIFCEQLENENPKSKHLQLISSEDWFAKKTVHFENIMDFATMSEFIIVAARANDSLKVDASIDGKTFAEAKFPYNFNPSFQSAYTVLDSSTHSVMLHVTVNNEPGREFGSILKSNSNGTSYVLSLEGVNRDKNGYVDFEKMLSLEGVALANIVGNLEDVEKKKSKKMLKTMITHNDGSEWAYLTPPEKDSEGRKWDCKPGKDLSKCALHLHAFTEDKDFRDTYSSPSAVGLLIGLGNVGEYLGLRSEANTFLSRDGGITWKEIRKGVHAWEFGDQGSIIALVPEGKPTKTLSYSLDEGETWREFQFSEVDMQIEDISTVPSDNSRNFVLWGKEVGSGGKPGFSAVNVDFSGLKERSQKCKFNEDNPTADDYYLWEPKHPLQKDNCLFGHIAQYHRKKTESECYNDEGIQHLSHIKKNCECTRRDYECDYNFARSKGGACTLISGLDPADPTEICRADQDAVEWYEPTGYRKIPLSTCEGGLQLDHIVAHPCPKKEKEFKKKHPGISGVALFFAITVPIVVALGVGYYVYTKWDGKFGHIRLGDTPSGTRGIFDSDSPLVRGSATAISAVVAVASAIPLLFSSLWRSFKSRFSRSQRPYASRGAFAARRGDYMGVADDEDELLGTDDFEDDEPEA